MQEQAPPPARTSTWAYLSLLCAIAVCCPAMPVLSILFAARALIEIKTDPRLGGGGLAKVAIVISVLAIGAWVVGGFWWHHNARVPMIHGPQRELDAGLAGDIAGFKSGFTEPGQNTPDFEAREFIEQLRTRYGEFQGSMQSITPTHRATMSGQPILPISYTLHFQRQLVEADAAFITFGQPRGALPNIIFKWHWIRVVDPVRGDLIYPASLAAEAIAPPATAPATQPSLAPPRPVP